MRLSIKNILVFFAWLITVVGLTILTQIGGILLLCCVPLFYWLSRQTNLIWLVRIANFIIFGIAYFAFSQMLMPNLAKKWTGKVPLPYRKHEISTLRPINRFLWLCNRHYVTPELREMLLKNSEKFAKENPNLAITYLDASFPFDFFPMLPHLSHKNGKQVDIAFAYMEKEGNIPTNEKPSNSGYGVYEAPRKSGEEQTAAYCMEQQKNTNYDVTKYLTFGSHAENLKFDAPRTAQFIKSLTKDIHLSRLFLEPHLVNRLGLKGIDAVRFAGCQSVRHDDHYHVEVW